MALLFAFLDFQVLHSNCLNATEPLNPVHVNTLHAGHAISSSSCVSKAPTVYAHLPLPIQRQKCIRCQEQTFKERMFF